MNIFSLLVLAFVAVPVVEIYLFIEIGGLIGAGWTVAVVILTAILGASLLRQQGLSTLLRARQQMNQAQIPAQEMVEGLVLVFCGGLLLTPGFFTDTVGFLLLLPGLRRRIARSIMDKAVIVGGAAAQPPSGFSPSGRHGQGDTIEGEYRRDD